VAGVNTTHRLYQIQVPTLIIAGELDLGTPPAMARTMHERIEGSQLVVLARASHLSVLEAPEDFSRVVAKSLQDTLAHGH
jgi:3-oxoadipate enol-lactonase